MKLIKEIKGRDGFVYFKRWRVLSLGLFNIDIHEFFLPFECIDMKFDNDHFLHNHPRRFISYIMEGGYWEKYKKDKNTPAVDRLWVKSSFNFIGPKCFHKIDRLLAHYCKTLVFTSSLSKPWGYLDDTDPDNLKIISEGQYRKLKNEGFYDTEK